MYPFWGTLSSPFHRQECCEGYSFYLNGRFSDVFWHALPHCVLYMQRLAPSAAAATKIHANDSGVNG